ncbi:cohesin domain-containing protein [Pseudoalteromonas luteoviolacea]|uniref:Cohesin domain-containing protein n=1 Tax=Pseudoalteromonas luteoviolacea NCIMB 1942 TaxID=1365253 RepID=A0A166Z367_9GAMM|nr:cohesin domain-containing protein [Pseudoalteromonas luteoviolacea]KZN43784.1 hypothetical protein N482_18310 [Pseudoalteromonas luteoviolacea NCIMB 1942]KZX01476.1 hypothetical protein JL49_04990 [Pseudoalteromonas luteoviolacea]
MRYLISILLLILNAGVFANEGQVHLISSIQQAQSGSEFYIDVQASELPEVYGMHLVIKFDADKLTIVDKNTKDPSLPIEHGNFFDNDRLYVLTNSANTQTGNIEYIVSQVKPAQSASGNGRLARVFFKSKEGAMATKVSIEKVEFGSKNGEKFIYEAGSELSFEFDNTYPVPVEPPADYPFTSVITILGAVLAILLLGLLLKSRGKTNSRSAITG